MIYFGICTSCNEEVEIHQPSDYEGCTMCPECRDIDTIEETPKCSYCNPKNYHIVFNRSNMCPDCREDYDDHLERKADERRDEKLIEKLEEATR